MSYRVRLMPVRLASLVLTLVVVAVGGWRLSAAATGFGAASSAVREAQLSGDSHDSYFRASNLSAALGALRARTGPNAKFLQLAVYPGYVAADVSTGSEVSGRAYKIGLDRQVNAAPLTLTGPGALAASVFPVSRLSPYTPERLIAQLTRTHGVSMAAVGYLVATVNPATGKAGWNLYPSNGATHYESALDGSGLNDPAAVAISQARSAIAGTSKAHGTAAGSVTASQFGTNVVACLTAAGTDVHRVAACTR